VKSMQKPTKTLISTAVLTLLTGVTAHAGGFSLYTESNGYSVGNFGAGVAAEAKDASTTWYNPAGLALIRDEQIVFGGVGVFPKADLTGTSSFNFTNPLTGTVFRFPSSYNNLSVGRDAFVPSGYFAMPLGENATFGIGLLAPFGLATEVGRSQALRYAATFSELLTFNLTPAIGGKVTENLSVGAGIDLQYSKVKFNSILGNPVLGSLQPPTFSPLQFDSLSYNKGQSTAVGFHAGVLGMFNDNHTRIGLNYQSKMKHKFNGYSRLSGPLAGPTGVIPTTVWNTNLTSNRIEFPEVVTLSAYQDVHPRVALLGSVVYTGWHVLRNIQLNNVVLGSPGGFATPPAPSQPFIANSTSTENYDNVWRFAIGANVKVNEKALIRFGGGYDATPTQNRFRTVRLPDADRWALSIGGHYQANPNFGIDLGYTYLWADSDPTINKTTAAGAASTFTVNARGDVNAHLAGIQLNWKTDMVSKTIKKVHV